VSCHPVEGHPLSAVVTLEPKQAGTGDPAPDNVRPISGYDSVTVTQSKDEAQVKQITLTLPETIYGGTVDAVTGEGEKTWETIVINEDFIANHVFTDYGGNLGKPGFSIFKALNGDYNRINGLCSHAVVASNSNPYPDANSFIWLGVSNTVIYWLDAFAAFGVSSLDDAKNALIAQATAGTPVTIAYQLATPEPFQASGNQPIPALAGLNTVYTDGNSLAVSGRSDPLSTIKTMQAQITALQDQATQGGTV